MEPCAISNNRAVLTLHLHPGAKRNAVLGRYGNAIKVAVKAPPVDGKANGELLRFIAELAGVAPRNVELLSGAASREKKVAVSGKDPEAVCRIFNALGES